MRREKEIFIKFLKFLLIFMPNGVRAIDDRFGKQHNQLGDISLRFYIHSPNQIENVKALSDSIMLLNINESAESERHVGKVIRFRMYCSTIILP